MKRLVILACCLAAACGVLAAYGSAVVLATAPPTGKLTGSEYAQLVAQQRALKKAWTSRAVFTATRAACKLVGNSTALAKDDRADCLTSVVEFIAMIYVPYETQACERRSSQTTTETTTTATDTTTGTTTTGTTGTTTTGATTTGTTTNPTTTTPTTAAPGLTEPVLVCMNPYYQALHLLVTAGYARDVTLRNALVARRLPARCIAVIGTSPSSMKHEAALVVSARKLAADAERLSKVAANQAGSGQVNLSGIYADEVAYARAQALFLFGARPTKLSFCPHE
jgi:hypothetical protein